MSNNARNIESNSMNPETHHFMQVQMVEQYSDANFRTNVDFREPTPLFTSKKVKGTSQFLIKGLKSNEDETKNFTGTVNRTLSIKTIPKGTILFTYVNLVALPDGTSDTQNAHYLFSKMLHYTSIPCIYYKDTHTYEFMYTNYSPSKNYFYPVASAGFGISGYEKNSCIAVITQHDMDIAYLKEGGTTDPHKTTTKAKMTTAQFPEDSDYRRVVLCPKLTGKVPGLHGSMHHFDVCLETDFMKANNLAGYTTVAPHDAIYTMRDTNVTPHGKDYDKTLLSMGIKYKDWLSSVAEKGNNEKDIYLHTMNMMAIETDRVQTRDSGTLYFGFPEYLINPFGSVDMLEIINGPFLKNPDNLNEYHPLISSTEVMETQNITNANGTQTQINVKMLVRVHEDNIEAFLEKFHYPLTAVRAFNAFTVNGSSVNFGIRPNTVPAFTSKPEALIKSISTPLNYLNRIRQRSDYEYTVNNHIANTMFQLKDLLMYDLLKNVFLLTDATLTDRDKPFTGATKVDAENKIVRDIPKGYYDILINSNEAIQRALKIKTHHDALSFLPPDLFNALYMREYNIELSSFIPGSSEIFHIPIGPFYNPLKIDSVNELASITDRSALDVLNLLTGVPVDDPLRETHIKEMVYFSKNYVYLRAVIKELERETLIQPIIDSPDMHLMTKNLITSAVLAKIVQTYKEEGPEAKPRTIRLFGSDSPPTEFYNGSFYNGEWKVKLDLMKKVSGPVLPPGSVNMPILPPPVAPGFSQSSLPSASLPSAPSLPGWGIGITQGTAPLAPAFSLSKGFGASGFGASGFGASGFGASGFTPSSGFGASGFGASGFGIKPLGFTGFRTSPEAKEMMKKGANLVKNLKFTFGTAPSAPPAPIPIPVPPPGINHSEFMSKILSSWKLPTPPENETKRPNKRGGRLMVNSPVNTVVPMAKLNGLNKRKIKNTRNLKNRANRKTKRNMNQNISGFRPLDSETLRAYNTAVKIGLLDNFFIKLSGKPVKYKTAN